MSLTQTQLASSVADRAELSKTDAKRALAALEEIVLEQLGNAEKVRIGGVVQLTVRVKPAQKKRICCAQHMRFYVACRTDVALGPNMDAGARDRGLPAQHNFGASTHAHGGAAGATPASLAIRRPNAIEHASLEFRAGLNVHGIPVEPLIVGPQRDGRDVKPSGNMLR